MGFAGYAEDLRVNFAEVAGAVAKPEAQNPIIRYDKYLNTYFNFETQGYYLRRAYRAAISYELTRALSLLEIYYNIFDPGTAGAWNTLYESYANAIEALEQMPAGQSPEKIGRSAETTGAEEDGGIKNFRVYCPTFHCDITGLCLQHRITSNEVSDEQLREFADRLYGRSLEQELKLAGLWESGHGRRVDCRVCGQTDRIPGEQSAVGRQDV